MIILGVETSCDETALSLVRCEGDLTAPRFELLGATLFSQIAIHAEYGGVYPNLARREHQKNIVPLLIELLKKVPTEKVAHGATIAMTPEKENIVRGILAREQELIGAFLAEVPRLPRPKADAIAVTMGPGLEPALWVGINFAKALGVYWDSPVIPTNHMEGHIISPLLATAKPVAFPGLALLISGGHTELVLLRSWRDFQILGATRDDAVGEAFDKVARILGLPYPGGPEISKLAARARQHSSEKSSAPFKLPRPMIASDDFDFSFAGLKTAVLYGVQNLIKAQKDAPLSETQKEAIAAEFEDAATEVLVSKTRKALEKYAAQTLIIGGGVSANNHIREAFEVLAREQGSTELLLPSRDLATDNAVMIAMAAYLDHLTGSLKNGLFARGNAKIGTKA